MENRAYGNSTGRLAFLYKLPPKLLLLLNTLIWLAAGLLIGTAAKELLGLHINAVGTAAFLSLVMGYCGSVVYLIRRK